MVLKEITINGQWFFSTRCKLPYNLLSYDISILSTFLFPDQKDLVKLLAVEC